MALNPPIETLFLDVGGVLTFPNWNRISDTFARHGVRVTAEALRRADPLVKLTIDQTYANSQPTDADRGGLYMNLMLDHAGAPRSSARESALAELYAYHAKENLWELVPDDVIPTLERLSGAGLKLAIASNANGTLRHALDRLGVSRFFHTICDSHVEGFEKPDPRFFKLVLERSGAQPETTLHVGDLYYVDVVGARASGLRAMLIDPYDLYRGYAVDRIKSLGDLIAAL